MSNVHLIIGPPVQSMTRTAAEQALLRNPLVPEGAEYTIDVCAGRYVAAFVDADAVYKSVKATKKAAKAQKQAEFGEGGGPADSSEESPAPKSEGPDDSEPSEGGESSGGDSDGGESKSEGGESKGHDGPPEHGKSEHGGGDEAAVLGLLQAIADALGVVAPPAGGMAPGADPMGAGGPPAPPAGPAGGHAGPPAPPHGGGPAGPGAGPMGPGGNQHVMHEKSGPPMPPTFSSSHPWAHTVGKVAHFTVAEEIGEQNVADMERELQAVASAGGFEVKRARPERGEDGVMRFAAIIKTPSVQ